MKTPAATCAGSSPEETATVRRVPCPALGGPVLLPEKPRRVVSLVSGLTEALWEMGLADRVAGVSHYCRRYVPVGTRPVVGDYLRIDARALEDAGADLVLMTAGVQAGVARKLAADGFPVYVLPLPDSLGGVLENIRRLGALLGEMERAQALEDRMLGEIAALRAQAPERRPTVYAELWFGRHPRMAGGLSFIHDILSLAGGRNAFGHATGGYLKLDLAAVEAASPDVVLLFSEEDDHPVDAAALWRERGWLDRWPAGPVECGIQRGRNLIHDGPSLLETARWLREQLCTRMPAR